MKIKILILFILFTPLIVKSQRGTIFYYSKNGISLNVEHKKKIDSLLINYYLPKKTLYTYMLISIPSLQNKNKEIGYKRALEVIKYIREKYSELKEEPILILDYPVLYEEYVNEEVGLGFSIESVNLKYQTK